MKLIAESGSTKCDWIGVGDSSLRVCTEGINAMLHTPAQIGAVLAALPRGLRPECVYFYGAGCGDRFPAATESLRELLVRHFGTPHVEVSSDLLAAARGLLGHSAGVACILGTGSNSCYYDGRQVVCNVPPLGYILGDEGSGAALGRKLLNGLFKGHLGDALLGEFCRVHGLGYEGVIRRVYREPQANRFLASLTPFIREHLDAEGMRELVCGAFAEFEERNLRGYPLREVAFTGGVAAAFEPELREVLTACGYRVGRVEASPAEGLIEYHGRE